MVYSLLWINVCWILLGSCLALDILLEFHHNIGDGFQKAGKLNATLEQSQLKPNTVLRLSWETSEGTLSSLRSLADKDGLYSFRVRSESTGDSSVPLAGNVLFSIPAQCFLASLQGRHRLDLTVAPNGRLVGAQWRYPKTLDCSTWRRVSAWPMASSAKALLPTPGDDLSVVQSMGIADKGDVPFQGGLAELRRAPEAYNPDGSVAQPKAGQGGKPEKEKTFLERNWVLLLGMGFLAVNLLLKPPPPPPGQQQRPAQSSQ